MKRIKDVKPAIKIPKPQILHYRKKMEGRLQNLSKEFVILVGLGKWDVVCNIEIKFHGGLYGLITIHVSEIPYADAC